MEWYPRNPDLLEKALNKYLDNKPDNISEIAKKINGIIVPHAGYNFSGHIAGKAFNILMNSEKNLNKAIILAPSHHAYFKGIASISKAETPLGQIQIEETPSAKIDYEHAIDNQIPFLQKTGFTEILPLVIGEMDEQQIEKTAQEISEKLEQEPETALIISTDLSHFLSYDKAIDKDKQTIDIIQNLDIESSENIDACGKTPLKILIHICKIKNWKPQLIEYKNSGDIIGDKSKVVGYASMVF